MTTEILIISILLILINIFICIRFNQISILINLFDLPDDKRKIHKEPVAAIGGFIIFFNLILIYFYNLYTPIIEDDLNHLIIFSFFIFLICAYDDKYDLSANIKFLLIIAVVMSAIFFDENLIIEKISFNSTNSIILLHNYSIFFTLLSVMLLINALNMFDGVNLQLSSYVTYFFVYLVINDIFSVFLSLMIVPLIFFLYLNYRNKIFLGDSGSCLLAFIISYVVIFYNKNYINIEAEKLFLLMFLPGVDMFRLFLLRIYNKKNPFKADKTHIHHLLLDKLNKKKYYIIIHFFLITPMILMNFIHNLFLISFYIIIYIVLLSYLYKKN